MSKSHGAVEVVEATLRGNRLKSVLARFRPSLTQEEAARRLGISYRHFNRIVLGVSEPSLLLAMRMQAVLGTPIERLFRVKLITRRRQAARGLRPAQAMN